MKRLDRARVAQSGGDLRRFLRKLRDQALADARCFEKISAIVWPERVRLDAHAIDQVFRIRREDQLADAFFAGRRAQLDNFGVHGGTHTRCAAAGSASSESLAGRVPATRFAARKSDSNVP